MGYVVGDTWYRDVSDIGAGMRQIENNKRVADFFDNANMMSTSGASAAAQAEAARQAAAEKAAGAQRAIEIQNAALATGTDEQNKATAQARDDVLPWRTAGIDALGRLTEKIAAGPGEFEKSPGYEARLAEGQKAIERSAAARGGVLSGSAVKAATRYGQEFATNDYDNFLRRYYDSLAPDQALSTQGMNAAGRMGEYTMGGQSQINQMRTNAANQTSMSTQYGADAISDGTMNAGNIMAINAQAEAERQYAYNAWKRGGDF